MEEIARNGNTKISNADLVKVIIFLEVRTMPLHAVNSIDVSWKRESVDIGPHEGCLDN